ncbi:MAG TPA: hypothetical protein VMS87_03505 [Roseiarcus sp.]|nr:hypothetical protein [Roseiarcus sp.]
MSVSQILLILWRRSWIVLLTLLVASSVAIGVLLFVPGRYDAVATASIDPASVDPVTESERSTGAMIALMQGNMLQLVQSQRVALDVVKRLNLAANPTIQGEYRASFSFGRESIEDWTAGRLLKYVDPKFLLGSNVLTIKYKSGDPNQSALVANAFLAATIDATVAMKAAAGEQTARWFAPQVDELRNEVAQAREALENFQKKTNIVAPNSNGVDSEGAALTAINQELSSARTTLTIMQTRLDSGATNLSMDPSDPDLQVLSGLKEKLATALVAVDGVEQNLGSKNPKMVAETANIASLRRQIADAADRMKDHLKERIASLKEQIARLEAAQAEAQKNLIDAQAQRDRLVDLQRDVGFRMNQLNLREKVAAQAKLQSKLTFADITVLDKAAPPIDPAFPKPIMVIPVGIGGGLTLGLILALMAEMTDRRVRIPADLEYAASAPMLGVIGANGRFSRVVAPRSLRAA